MTEQSGGAPREDTIVSKETFTFPHAAASISGTVAAGAGNLLQPMLPIVWISVFAFAGIWGFCLLAKRKKKARDIKGLSSFAAMGTMISAFLLAAQYIPGSADNRNLTQEVGVVAATIPGVVSVQNAVLPISKKDKDMNAFRLAIARGDDADRGLAARTLIEEQAEPPVKNALVDLALRSDVATVRQAGLVKALHDRAGAFLPLDVESGENAAVALPLLRGAQFMLQSVDTGNGVVRGTFECTGDGRRVLDGMIASGRLSFTATCYSRDAGGWRTVRVALQPDASNRLVGEAKMDAETVAVSAPLL